MSLENTNSNNRLQELGGSDYEIVDGEPNIKGWDVKDANGQKLGEVEELLFDEKSRKVRYIILDLEGNVLDLEERNVLVPIGMAQLHDKDDDVVLPGITADQIRSLPEYHKGKFGADDENRIRTIFAGTGAAVAGVALTPDKDDFYDHDHFNEKNLYSNRNRTDDDNASIPVVKEELEIGKREVETGGIRLRSRIVETPVEESINLREEQVRVERTPVDRAATASDIREDSLEVTEKAEVPVIHKEARVVEEVSLNKEVTEREETIRDTVRNTEVDIEKKEGSDNLTKGTGSI